MCVVFCSNIAIWLFSHAAAWRFGSCAFPWRVRYLLRAKTHLTWLGLDMVGGFASSCGMGKRNLFGAEHALCADASVTAAFYLYWRDGRATPLHHLPMCSFLSLDPLMRSWFGREQISLVPIPPAAACPAATIKPTTPTPKHPGARAQACAFLPHLDSFFFFWRLSRRRRRRVVRQNIISRWSARHTHAERMHYGGWTCHAAVLLPCLHYSIPGVAFAA